MITNGWIPQRFATSLNHVFANMCFRKGLEGKGAGIIIRDTQQTNNQLPCLEKSKPNKILFSVCALGRYGDNRERGSRCAKQKSEIGQT